MESNSYDKKQKILKKLKFEPSRSGCTSWTGSNCKPLPNKGQRRKGSFREVSRSILLFLIEVKTRRRNPCDKTHPLQWCFACLEVGCSRAPKTFVHRSCDPRLHLDRYGFRTQRFRPELRIALTAHRPRSRY